METTEIDVSKFIQERHEKNPEKCISLKEFKDKYSMVLIWEIELILGAVENPQDKVIALWNYRSEILNENNDQLLKIIEKDDELDDDENKKIYDTMINDLSTLFDDLKDELSANLTE